MPDLRTRLNNNHSRLEGTPGVRLRTGAAIVVVPGLKSKLPQIDVSPVARTEV